ncbi:MAG TPA: PAS domain-containing sensor histidine kinase, partial [Euryarchaeota archaeon]|nr:PAS domain-containing sensor histidine kinase [Euryarchaeota archaeon]
MQTDILCSVEIARLRMADQLVEWAEVVDILEEGIFTVDPEYNILSVNKHFAELVGMSKAELMGRKCYGIVHGTKHPPPSCALAKALKTREPASVEVKESKLGGATYLSKASPVLDEKGGVKYAVISMSDISPQKRLKEPLNTFRKFAETSSLGHGFADIKGNIVYANPSLQRMLGALKMEDLLGKNVIEFYPQDVQPKLSGEILPDVKKNGKWFGELPLKSATGEITPTIQNISLITDDAGKALYFGNAITDISTRKKTEEALEESKQKYRALVESSSSCICHIDLNGKIIFMNSGGVRLNELSSPDELIGAECTRGVKEECRGQMEQAVETAKKGGTTHLEYESLSAKGSTMWWESTVGPITDGKGRITGIVRVSRNITERRNIEERLRETTTFLDNIVHSAPEAIMSVDLNDLITSFSPGAEALFRCSAEDMIGQSVYVLYPEELEEQRKVWKERILSGETVRVDTVQLRPDGSVFDVSLSMAPLRDGKEDIIGIVGISHDITKEVKAEKALKKAYLDLKKMDQMKDEFLQNVTHEFRTPITAMLTTNRLLKDSVTDENLRKILELNERSAWRLNRLVGGILDYSTVENGAVKMNLERLDLAAISSEVVSTLQASADDKNIDVKIEMPKTPMFVLGDKDSIHMILNNLLNNAIKFNKKGGTISVFGRLVDGFMEVTIADTGVGIPKKEVGMVFDRFYQVDGTMTRRFSGTGIGLALTKKLVEL